MTGLAAALEAGELVAQAEPVDWVPFAAGAVLSALTAFLCIHFFLKWLTRFGMLPLVLYRLALGSVIFAVLV